MDSLPGESSGSWWRGRAWRRLAESARSAAEGEDAEGAAELGLAEGGGFGFAEGAQFAGAALDDCAGDFVRKSGGFGAGAFGEGEDVEVGEGEALDEMQGGGVVGLRFRRGSR